MHATAALRLPPKAEGVVEFVDATTIRIRYDRTDEEQFVAFDEPSQDLPHT